MRNSLLIKILFALLLFAQATIVEAQRKVGYMPSWAGDANAIQYSKLTHINYSFAIPQSNGSIMAVENGAKLQTIVSKAHAAGVKVLIAIGGWSYQGALLDGTFETLASNATSRDRFINDAMYIVNQYNLDGVDIDWEYPDAGASSNNFDALMTGLSNRLKPAGKLLSAAVIGSGGSGVSSTVFNVVDYLNIMSYDGNNYDHSTFSYATQCLNYWTGRGLSKSKANLGVPFYGRPSWSSYATLVNQGADPNADFFNGNGYNGIATIKQKAQYVKDNGYGGIMIWEISQDLFDNRSLVSAIHSVIGSGGTTNPTTQTPYGGTAAKIPGTIQAANYDLGGTLAYYDNTGGNSGGTFRSDDVDVEACTEGGYNIGWTAAGEWTEYTVNVTAGTYKIEARVAATAAGKSFRVDMDGSAVATFSVPNTGGWQTWQTVTVNNVNLSGGQKVMRIYNITDGFNVSNIKFTAGTTPPPTGPAVVYQNCNNDPGYAVALNVGNYTTAQLNALGIADNDVSRVTVQSGYQVILYADNNFGGSSVTLTSEASCLTNNSFNDVVSSIKVSTVTTNNNQAPSVNITAPGNNASFNAPANITISANASDADGSVTKVDFYNGSTLLNSDASAPYSFNWNNVAAGTYTITARATDNKGATTTSGAITVKVNTVTTGGCSGIAQYVENNGYGPGSKVQNAGSQYQCKPFPYSGWCNGASWAYGPGVGAYWSDAWTLVGSCNARSAADTDNNTTAIVNENMLTNSPNPFNGSTNIEVSIANAGEVSIIVYNKTGQVVKTVTEGNLSAGTHNFDFDASELTPGMYIVKCNTSSGVTTRKIMKAQ